MLSKGEGGVEKNEKKERKGGNRDAMRAPPHDILQQLFDSAQWQSRDVEYFGGWLWLTTRLAERGLRIVELTIARVFLS